MTPRKKNRSRSTSLESREHEISSSAKKRKHDSNHRSRSSSKKFKEELWRENGHNKAADLITVAAPTTANEQNSATDTAKASVSPSDVEMKSEQCDRTINSTAEPTASSKQQPSTVKAEPRDGVDDEAGSSANDATNILTPRVRIVDIRSHLTEDEEPVSPCANSQPYPVVNNGNTTSKCSVDQHKKDHAARPKAEAVVDDASHPVTEPSSIKVEEEPRSKKQ